MARTAPFETAWQRYDAWFERHRHVYEAELRAVSGLLPENGTGLEVGVGSGRFAGPLKVAFGLDPSWAMCCLASERGITVVRGVGEALPFADGTFDFVLMVTTICFLDDVPRSFAEARRVVSSSGQLIVGFVDRDSELGRFYQQRREASAFYSVADFYSARQALTHLKQAGFGGFRLAQTIFHPLPAVTAEEPVLAGSGRGSFVVIAARVATPGGSLALRSDGEAT